jgi:two-component system chemotaxis sensor kinase CheA
MNAEFDSELRQDFLVEAGELLQRLGEQLVGLEAAPGDGELLNAVFRAFHTVKGGAGFLALEPTATWCSAPSTWTRCWRRSTCSTT